jgi:hypothetical protein
MDMKLNITLIIAYAIWVLSAHAQDITSQQAVVKGTPPPILNTLKDSGIVKMNPASNSKPEASSAPSSNIEFSQKDEDKQLSTAQNNVLEGVDIIGENGIGSLFILWDALDLSEDMKKQMSTRNLASDEFFMQNIDREEFEQERVLMMFEDRKRQYFKLLEEEEKSN